MGHRTGCGRAVLTAECCERPRFFNRASQGKGIGDFGAFCTLPPVERDRLERSFVTCDPDEFLAAIFSIAIASEVVGQSMG